MDTTQISPLRSLLGRLALVLLLCIAVAPVATPVAAQSDPAQPSGAIDVENTRERDAAIAVRLRGILQELEGYGDVTVTVKEGIVTFRGTTLDTPTAARLNELAGRVQGVVAVENEVFETTDVARRLNPTIARFKLRMAQLVNYAPLLAIAVMAFGLVMLSGLLLARLRYPWEKIAPNLFIADIYRQILRLAFGIGGIVVALDILGATALLSTILGAAGIIGLAIGFAVRDTVENFIASVMLSIRQPFSPNETIEIGGDTGKVIRLTSRATILLSFDGNQIRIPNATVFKSRIVNFSRNPERRFSFDVAVPYGTDLAAAIHLAEDRVRALPFVLDSPDVAVWTESLLPDALTLRITGWIDQRVTSLTAARTEAIRQTLSAFHAAGIPHPDPTLSAAVAVATAAQATAQPAAKATGQARPQAVIPVPVSPPPPVGPDAAMLDVHEHTDGALEKIIADEREAAEDTDLLARQAPLE